MKKTLVWSLVLALGAAFVFSSSVFAVFLTDEGMNQNSALFNNANSVELTSVEATSTQAQISNKLERILSPDQISNFRDIIKEGKDLFGIRKMFNGENEDGDENDEENKMTVREQNQDRVIEKIGAPQFVKMYENIRQIGNALWGVKKDDSKEDQSNQNIADRLEELKTEIHIQSPSDLSLFTNIRKTTDGKMFGILKELKEMPDKYAVRKAEFSPISENERECVIDAISEKDVAIQANNLKFAEDLNNSIQTRNTCQIDALSKSADLQQEAVVACNTEFNETQEQVREQSREAQDSFWKNYKESLSSCRAQATSTDAIIIDDGGANIY